jgi:hypothetical protein
MNTTWITPQWLINAIGISDLDPCGYFGPNGRPLVETAREYIVLPRDGLTEKWHGSVFCNPPYDANAAWCRKCAQYHKETGNDVFILIFAKTETEYFQETVAVASAINFLYHRVKFLTCEGRVQGSPTHPSVIIALGEGAAERIKNLAGITITLHECWPEPRETFTEPKCLER